MEIEERNDTHILFKGVGISERVFLWLCACLLLWMSWVHLDLARNAEHASPFAAESVGGAPTTLGNGAACALFLAVSMWTAFAALPFQLEILSAPRRSRRVWRFWTHSDHDLEPSLAVVAKPRRYRGRWGYSLYARTPRGDFFLLGSRMIWVHQRDAGSQSIALGNTLATFLDCEFRHEGWKNDPTLGPLPPLAEEYAKANPWRRWVAPPR